MSDLKAAVEAVYAAFATPVVPVLLEVCHCPVCMTEDTRDQIAGAVARDLSAELISQYTASAHGVPQDAAALRALLPRYLELIAQDAQVCEVGVGTELLRFGDAVRQGTLVYSEDETAALGAWMQAAIAHFNWLEVHEGEAITSPFYLFEMLMCGGWPVADVIAALELCFNAPDTGLAAFAPFAGIYSQAKEERKGHLDYPVDLFALGYCAEPVRRAVLDWINSKTFLRWLDRLSKAHPDAKARERSIAFIAREKKFVLADMPDHRGR